MFSGGYAAHSGEDLIRGDVCLEALRLGRLVASSSMGAPRVDALVALMALQTARLPARTDTTGDLVLLEEQDRELWDKDLIALGFSYFDRSIAGDEISEWHVQAAIAATYASTLRGTYR
jgi:RNA polymerase sigma-70 factor (ECF subfamily)